MDNISQKDFDELKFKMDRIYEPRKVTDVIPTTTPRNIKEQIVLYISGTTYRQYTYMNGDWYYVNLTKV
jgi:hypothetical protein